MLGPGLALRGGEGAASMHKAVDTMAREANFCFKFFLAQLIFFYMSCFSVMWVLYPKSVAMAANVVLAIFMILFMYDWIDTYGKLAIQGEAATGKFSQFSMFEEMDELDNQ